MNYEKMWNELKEMIEETEDKGVFGAQHMKAILAIMNVMEVKYDKTNNS